MKSKLIATIAQNIIILILTLILNLVFIARINTFCKIDTNHIATSEALTAAIVLYSLISGIITLGVVMLVMKLNSQFKILEKLRQIENRVKSFNKDEVAKAIKDLHNNNTPIKWENNKQEVDIDSTIFPDVVFEEKTNIDTSKKRVIDVYDTKILAELSPTDIKHLIMIHDRVLVVSDETKGFVLKETADAVLKHAPTIDVNSKESVIAHSTYINSFPLYLQPYLQ